MTALLVETDGLTRTFAEPTSPRRLRPGRPRRDGVRPQARPTRRAAVPAGVRGASAHACADDSFATPVLAVTRSNWRLTDRGLAVVLVLASMIALAAVVVVGLTAFRVTSPSYQPYGQSALQR